MTHAVQRAMQPGQSGPRLLLSVFPEELTLNLLHEGSKTYVMPAAEKGGYTTLYIDDTYAWMRDLHSQREAQISRPVSAQDVVENLLQAWSGAMVGAKESGAGP